MIAAKPRAQYLFEMQELTARFEELAEAFKPVAGEVDTMIVPISLLRNLMRFCESSLARLQKVADHLPDEILSEVLAAGDRGGEASNVSDVREEWFQP